MKKRMIEKALIAALLLGTAVSGVKAFNNPVCVQAATAGWQNTAQGWQYQNTDGTYSTSVFQVIWGKTFYFNEKSIMVVGWKKIDGIWYYFNENGAMKKGWLNLDNKWYYFKEDGSMASSQWIGDKYYIKKDGIMASEEWAIVDGEWYYLRANGTKIVNNWLLKNNKWYYLLSDGKMAKSRWIKNRYYINDSGEMVNGWLLYKKKYFYLNLEDGAYVTGQQNIQGKQYYFDQSGAMQTGWIKLDEIWYFANKNTGALVRDWNKIQGEWYYFNQNYKMTTGWQKLRNQWYFLRSNGKMATGWLQYKNTWYYLDEESGSMAEGWIKLNGIWYYLKSGGAMVKDWYRIGGKWYYFESSGAMRSNAWVGDSYYVGPNGAMYVDIITSFQGVPYRFGPDGKNIPYLRMQDASSGKNYYIEPSYRTDPQIGTGEGEISLEDFFTAAVYCEAGDQGEIGMQAVAMVMLNRLEDQTEFPNDLRMLIYQATQYAICRDGSLTRALSNPALKNKTNKYYETARKAVQEAQAIMNAYKKKGTKRIIPGFPMPTGYTDFDYLFFMTPAAFARLEKAGSLDKDAVGGFTSYTPDANKTTGHVFFRYWRK